MSNTAISPTGYANILMSQISPQHSLDLQFNFRSLHHIQFTRRDCDTNNTSSTSNEGLWALLDLDPLPDDSMISQLKQEISKLQHTVAFLQSEKVTLVNENLCLNTKCETLQTILVNSQGSASSTASSSSLSVASDVKSWTKKDWQENMPSSTSANPGSSGKKRGATCMARGINVACTYLQDEAGQPVSAQRAKTIRLFMLSCFRQLESQGLAPQSIGQASLKKVPTSTCVANSLTSGTTTSKSTTTAPPSNNLSDTDASSLAVKMELLEANPAMSIPSNMIDSKAQPIKKQQLSTKPMCMSPKITAWNLCALDWQLNGHQKEPASIFAIFWNGLSSTNKEAYKRKVVQQLQSAGLPAAIDNADKE
ncbi:hypothetical protein DFJ58DRAFT_737272 [Suillus subalutaceus]|uniref:uncharacterized protein n=1 Tax=Suillus subalutaceus TaxID=48586 RepID=UPI001B85E9B5|nr:uncharacterized protein DFJ58DRAFT_737272 [Suillus subalutaceus]KAG1829554.1 hypothetical protein DFJ58DRAFT_737272 [Suillus subalutaceus]